jgi:hypothetical protein
MRSGTLASLLGIAAATYSCGGEAPPPASPAPPPAASTPAPAAAIASAAPSASAAPAAVPEPSKPASPSPAATYAGFSKPESVLYDADNDRYLVSNINGAPLERDNNGFISELSPDGQVTALKWIEGGKNKVKLDAPKGLAIAKGVLYVADITVVRMFDVKSGAPKGEVSIPGSTFLNDLASSTDGKVYASDSGLKTTADGSFAPTGTDAVYVIEKGKTKSIAKGAELGGPNGLLVTDKGIVVVTFGSGEVFRLDDKGKMQDVSKPPAGGLDGVVALGDALLVSSWKASAIFRGKLGGSFEVALADQKAPADIGYDTKRGRVLVPHFNDDTVEAYDLK